MHHVSSQGIPNSVMVGIGAHRRAISMGGYSGTPGYTVLWLYKRGYPVLSVGEEHWVAQKTRKVSYYQSLSIHEYNRLIVYITPFHPVSNL